MVERHRSQRVLHVPTRHPIYDGARRSINRQTPEFRARVITEKHRSKLVRDGSDTH
jgi:hypothetical protein